ncbi:hypothetical protein NE237_030021 [Protea cynaroides]|uniref:Uncharacterized protein n=1 Tax=Protea cynaroides TaxID=273540 RepID=A0A9Q0GTA1_9MAGN|nr:hypothetical protein NE237_030021 [Protea cynaroides]
MGLQLLANIDLWSENTPSMGNGIGVPNFDIWKTFWTFFLHLLSVSAGPIPGIGRDVTIPDSSVLYPAPTLIRQSVTRPPGSQPIPHISLRHSVPNSRRSRDSVPFHSKLASLSAANVAEFAIVDSTFYSSDKAVGPRSLAEQDISPVPLASFYT